MAKESAVLLLERAQASYCTRNSPTVAVFAFPADVVRDLDVLNKEQFITQFTTFIDTNKIVPANIVIILTDDILFEKDILKAPAAPAAKNTEEKSAKKLVEKNAEISQSEEIKKFLDTVPFESIASKIYPIDTGSKVIAANRDFYETIKHIFENKGSQIDAVVPSLLLGSIVHAPISLSAMVVKQILSRIDTLKQQSLPLHFVVDTPKSDNEPGFSITISKGGNKKRLALMVGVFALLLGVMAYMYMAMVASDSTTKKPPRPTPFPTVTPTASFTPTPTTSASGQLFMPDTKITILAASSATQAAKLKNILITNGFTNITITKQAGTSNGRALLIFSHTLTTETRDKISSALQQVTANFSTQETTDNQLSATITLEF